MTTYAWPWPWATDGFEMRVQPNERVFRSVFNPASAQTVDVGGDYWVASLRVPSNDRVHGAAIEAFLNRLRGSQNFLSLYHLKRPLPRGTMRGGATASWTTTGALPATWTTAGALPVTWTAGDPRLRFDVPQFATSCTVNTLPGYTLAPGDMLGMPNGQTVMYVGADTLVADASGNMVVEFAPAARSVMRAWGRIDWNAPTVNFRLRDGAAPPVSWRPGMYEGITLDLVEAI